MKFEERLKDWFFWVDWMIFITVMVGIILNFNSLERWKWGYWSIDLVPVYILMFSWIVIRNKIVEDRRFEWIKCEMKELRK